MGLSLIISLVAIGFVLILVEIFLTPGFIVGLVGVGFIAVGLGMVYSEYGTYYGNLGVVASIVLLSAAIIGAFKGGVWQKVAIEDEITGKANKNHLIDVKVGDTGVAISALRPAGSAIFNGEKIEVHSEGEFLLKDDKLQVVKKVGHKLIVKKII